MKRRDFMKLAAVAPFAARGVSAAEPSKASETFAAGEPVLQIPSETGIGVAWAVNRLSTGEVEIADNPEMRAPRVVKCGGLPLACLDDLSLWARVGNLKPATRYWYRTVTREVISDRNPGYAKIRRGEVAVGKTHSFVTLGAKAKSHFCVVNDTHAHWDSFAFTTAKLRSLKPAVTIWNGDALNCTEEKSLAVRTLLAPPVPTKDFAAESPVLWVNGNHDYAGAFAERLGEVMLTRPPAEHEGRFADLVRNFAVRQGDIALVGLDTGDGIHDDDVRMCGLGRYSEYRALQTEWLEDALSRPEIASAPFVVAFCHIPLWNTGENPFGCEEPRTKGCASWIRECYEKWGPVLDRHHVQLVVCGHEHSHRWDESIPRFGWKQVLGGGPELGIPKWGERGNRYFPTVIEGVVENGLLVVRTHDSWHDRIVDERRFEPRRV